MSVAQSTDLRSRLLAALADPTTIAPPPSSALRLMEMCGDPMVNPSELKSVVESEPAIATSILAVANSPLYGYSRRVDSIGHAIVIVGVRRISRLAAGFSARNVFGNTDQARDLAMDLYRHSLGTALVARNLTENHPDCSPDQAFLCGLLHDLGKLVLLQVDPARFLETLAETNKASRLAAEKETFGLDHEEVGGIAARQWGLPKLISEVVSRHHLDDDVESTPMASLVEAADWIAHRDGVGSPAQPDKPIRNGNPILQTLDDDAREQVTESARGEFGVLDSCR